MLRRVPNQLPIDHGNDFHASDVVAMPWKNGQAMSGSCLLADVVEKLAACDLPWKPKANQFVHIDAMPMA